MRLSLDVISEQLSASNTIIGMKLADGAPVKYGFPSLYRSGTAFQPDHLYIADAGELPQGVWLRSSVGLVVRGQPPESYVMQGCSVLSVSPDVSMEALFAAVSETFWKYQKWETKLNRLLAIHAPLEKYLEATYPLVRTSIFICDKVGRVLADIEEDLGEKHDSSSELVGIIRPLDQLFPSKDLQSKSMLSQKAFEATGRAYGSEWPCYYRRLSNEKDDFLGFLVLGSQRGQIREVDKLIANHLGDIVEFSLDRMIELEGRRRWEGSYLFKDVLEGTPLSYAEFNYRLEEQGLSNHRFCCIRLILRQSSLRLPVEHICWHVNTEIDDTFAMAYDSSIVLFLRLPIDTYCLQELPALIESFIKDGDFCAGVSHTFSSVRDARHYYFQARKAMELGMRHDPDSRCHFFSKYALQYILNQSPSTQPTRVLCMEGIKMLQDMDREHDSEYCRTLKVYFENGMHLQKTADDLYIHRSTLTYRLNRIRKEAGIDLDEYKSRLYAMLSLEMLEE